MPPSRYKEYKKDYYQRNKEHFDLYEKEHRKERNLYAKTYKARRLVANPEQYKRTLKKHNKTYRNRRKYEVLSHYSQGEPECKECGENRIACLTIDHLLGNGTKHRKEIGASTSTQFYTWLVKNGYPKGYQVLCMNCQFVKQLAG